MIPFYDEHGVVLQRVLTDRGTEYCGTHDRHEYELYLAVENIDHSRTKTKSPQTNGIVERFHKTMLDEFYRIAFRKRIYATIDELQTDLDGWLTEYNEILTIRAATASARRPCRPSLTAPRLSGKNRSVIRLSPQRRPDRQWPDTTDRQIEYKLLHITISANQPLLTGDPCFQRYQGQTSEISVIGNWRRIAVILRRRHSPPSGEV